MIYDVGYLVEKWDFYAHLTKAQGTGHRSTYLQPSDESYLCLDQPIYSIIHNTFQPPFATPNPLIICCTFLFLYRI